MAPASVFNQVVRVTYVYLGPAADRFVSRQISNHLHKKPDQLQGGDLSELIDWVRLAMGFLTDDQAMVGEYVSRLRRLEQKYLAPTSASRKQPKRRAIPAPHAKSD